MKTPAAVIFATRAGGVTLDRDAKGGNPFATALIELAGSDYSTLGAFAQVLRSRTELCSTGRQSPEWLDLPADLRWSLCTAVSAPTGRCVALVLIVSDYPEAGGWPLFGAAWDERRVSACFEKYGFVVTSGIAPERTALLTALRAFAIRSRDCESAVIYSTGHGVECRGETYLLPADYPFAKGYAGSLLAARAVSIAQLRTACIARATNLVFFGGCRTRVCTG
ncbi:caspase family protein [Thauera sinica]|uniref:Caspase family protein n=1 Tax=Thauera sinica TaxID=2665146 RepID=A0ABW1AQZ8_9RHOO|nr:caspase family protein [Thauera sp. K11]